VQPRGQRPYGPRATPWEFLTDAQVIEYGRFGGCRYGIPVLVLARAVEAPNLTGVLVVTVRNPSSSAPALD
jgi:hypothetical protein